MSIIIKHIWRNVKSNAFRSLLILFSLALSAAVFYLNLNIGQDVTESSGVVLKGVIKNYDLMIIGDIHKEELAIPDCDTTLALEADVARLGANDVILYYGPINRLLAEGLLVLDDAPDTFDPNTEGWVVMPRARAEYYGISPGESFTILRGTTPETYTLAAYVESPGMFSWANAAFGEVFIWKYDNLTPTVLCVDLSVSADVNAIADRLKNEHPDLRVNTLYESNEFINRMTGIRQVLSIVLLLIIGITFFVISSMHSLIINYRMPVLGTFRSIGATARKTNFLLLAESALYGLAAGVPGIVFGEIIRIIIRTQYLNVSVGTPRIAFVVLVPLYTILMSAAISLFAIIRAGKMPLKDLMFRKQSAATKPSAWVGILGVALLAASFVIAACNDSYSFSLLVAECVLAVAGVGLGMGLFCSLFSRLFAGLARKRCDGPVWLGLRNLGVNRINRSTALLVSVVIAMTMIIYVCVSSINAFFAEYNKNYPYDIILKNAIQPQDHYSYLETLDGVTSVVYEYWNIAYCCVNGADEEGYINFVAIDGYSNGIDVDESLVGDLQDGQVIVDYLYAKVHHFEIGDTLDFTIPTLEHDHLLSPYTATIVGFCDSSVFYSSRSTIMMTHNDFIRYVETTPAIIGISTSRDVYETIKDVNDATIAHDGKMYRASAKQDYVNSEINEAMRALKSVSLVPLLTFLLALCSLVNNQLIAFNQKRMLYAVLNSTAMAKKQLRTMILTELGTSFVVGCCVGLALSVWLAKIIRDILFISIAYVPIVFTTKQICSALLLLLLLLCITALFPLNRLKKMDIVKEIKYE